MKSLLIGAALLAGLAAPALAEEATAPASPQPPAQVAIAPSQDGAGPVIVPQSKSVESAPMSVPLESNSAPPSRSGCGRDKTTVYLTN